jgi:two-component system cell cycle response regulator
VDCGRVLDAARHAREAAVNAPPLTTILVIDAELGTRELLRHTLATAGYHVLEATSAHGALAIAARVLPDLIVQDLVLPDMDGVELLSLFRGLHGGNEVPILALAGFLGPVKELEDPANHFTASLLKPMDPSHFLAAVRAYLPQRQPRDASLGRGRHLLVVDDDPVQLKLTRLHFSHAGFDVSEAAGGAPGLAAARAHRPDVILCDVFMPEIDGFQFCLDCRTDPALAAVPIVLLSGRYGSGADQALARRVGANALVLRTPDFDHADRALTEALTAPAPVPAESPSDHLALTHARLVLHQLERQVAELNGVAQRCGMQATQLLFLAGIVDSLIEGATMTRAFDDRFRAALNAAGIAKGALLLRDTAGAFALRHEVGFSKAEGWALRDLFGRDAQDEHVDRGGTTVTVPSAA